MLRWEMGAQALNAVPTPEDATEMKMPVIREVDLSIDSTKLRSGSAPIHRGIHSPGGGGGGGLGLVVALVLGHPV